MPQLQNFRTVIVTDRRDTNKYRGLAVHIMARWYKDLYDIRDKLTLHITVNNDDIEITLTQYDSELDTIETILSICFLSLSDMAFFEKNGCRKTSVLGMRILKGGDKQSFSGIDFC